MCRSSVSTATYPTPCHFATTDKGLRSSTIAVVVANTVRIQSELNDHRAARNLSSTALNMPRATMRAIHNLAAVAVISKLTFGGSEFLAARL